MVHLEAEQPAFSDVPPEELWTEITLIGQDGRDFVVRLPFDAQEMESYAIGSDANARLIEQGGLHSGIEREYWIHAGQLFPAEWELQDRQDALMRIKEAADTAKQLMNSGQPVREESYIDFMTVSMLPSRFTAYGSE